MNRRGFLSSFIKGAVLWTVAPQIVTHGLGLVKPRQGIRFVQPRLLVPFWFQTFPAEAHHSPAYVAAMKGWMINVNDRDPKYVRTIKAMFTAQPVFEQF